MGQGGSGGAGEGGLLIWGKPVCGDSALNRGGAGTKQGDKQFDDGEKKSEKEDSTAETPGRRSKVRT